MPVFGYRGLAADGRAVSGVIDADSARGARGKLRGIGIFPTAINEEVAVAERRTLSERMPGLRRKMPATDLGLLTRQLGSLLGGGVPLLDALTVLADQATKPMVKKMLSQVRERVREGVSLADAMKAHPEAFSDLYVHMVRAGEQAGALETVLDRLADYSESQAELVRKVRGALTYPFIMMLVGTAIMGFLVTYVVPQVATIFSQTNQALPMTTQVLVGFANFLTTDWWLILLGLVGLAGAISYWLSTSRGRYLYDSWILKMPYLGPTITKVVAARFARTLATLLASGVQVLAALDAVKLVITNKRLAEAIQESRDSIREGSGIGQTLARSRLFPPMLVEMIRVGERSGELEPMLEKAASAYEKEVAASLSQMTTLLEPLMTIVMAGMIVFMILAVLMPIFQLNQLMQ
ncbi:MAG TPA: type II secretion system inner membrane protein GspF [Candidatus Binataceae bacterium]